MRGFTPKGDVSAWEAIYGHLAKLNVDDVFTHEQLRELIPHIVGPESSLRRAKKELLEKDARALKNVRGVGWRIVHAREQAHMAKDKRKRAAREIDMGRELVAHTRLDDLNAAELDVQRKVMAGLEFIAAVVGQHEVDIETLREQQAETAARLARLERQAAEDPPKVIDHESPN